MGKAFDYIESDYYRYTGERASRAKLIKVAVLGRKKAYKYCFWFRLAHFKNPMQLLAKLMHRVLSNRYKVFIPRDTEIGYGFYIGGPCFAVIINGTTKIGNNVNVSQYLNIGTNNKTPAIIGNCVYIGPHVSIVDDVIIEDFATIGAGAVLTKRIPKNSTAVGVPAKVISYDNPGRFINNPVDWIG